MKFYRPRGHHEPPVLWNPLTNSPRYEFVLGVCETEDPDTIELLRGLGFSEEPISANIQMAMDITADLTRAQPPPPPSMRTVPDREPPAPKPVVEPVAVPPPAPKAPRAAKGRK